MCAANTDGTTGLTTGGNTDGSTDGITEGNTDGSTEITARSKYRPQNNAGKNWRRLRRKKNTVTPKAIPTAILKNARRTKPHYRPESAKKNAYSGRQVSQPPGIRIRIAYAASASRNQYYQKPPPIIQLLSHHPRPVGAGRPRRRRRRHGSGGSGAADWRHLRRRLLQPVDEDLPQVVDRLQELLLRGLPHAEERVDGVQRGADENILRERGDVVALDDLVPQLHVHQRPLWIVFFIYIYFFLRFRVFVFYFILFYFGVFRFKRFFFFLNKHFRVLVFRCVAHDALFVCVRVFCHVRLFVCHFVLFFVAFFQFLFSFFFFSFFGLFVFCCHRWQ